MFRIAGNATGDIPSGLGSRDELAATTPQAVGKIQAALGSATITRARDIVVQVRIGALVYQGDVIETAADGAVAIMFKDGTAFNLSTSARMVLNEFICDPNANSNSARFGIAQGIFAFRAGKVAKSGGLSIDTPVARIRGATQGSGTGILTLAALTFAVTNDLHAHSQLAILDDDVITYKDLPHGTFEIVTRGGQIILADDPGETIRIDSAGNVTRVLLPSSRVAELQQAAHAVSLLSQDAGTAPGSGGSPSDSGGGTPDFLRLLPINYTSPPAIESLTITPFKDPFVFEPPPAPIFPHVVVTGTATEGSPMLLTGTLAGLGAVQAAGPDGLLGTFDDVLISPASFSLSSNTSGLPVLLAHGHVVSYSVAGNVLTASADGQMLFTLSLGAGGSWSFELLSQIDHVDDGTNSANTALRLAGGGSVNSIDFSSIILADGKPLGSGSFSVTVIDATPSVSGNGLVQLDDDALAGGNAGGTGDDPDAANTSGVLAHSYGADGSGSIAFLTSGAPSGFTYELSGSDLLVKQGKTVVLTVTLDTTTGAYAVTQNNPILHAAGSDENNQTFAISYQVTDADGDTATGTFSINVDDDAPTATAEASQNVAEGATVTGTLDFVAGADGATVTHIDGTALVFGEDGYSQAIDIGDGSIRVKADGSYKFTADAPVIGTGAASATFTVTDKDGDTATAAVSFVITDDNVPTGGTTAASVDDDGLTGGNPASTTDDLAVPNTDGDNNEATFGGTLVFSFGGDGAGTVGFASMHGTTATVGQETVTYSWNASSNTLTATGPRGVLFTVVVTNPATGAYTVTLIDNVLQAQGPNAENDATAALTYTITDADGSSTTGTLNITFDDDAPTISDIRDAILPNVNGTIFNGTWNPAFGGDGIAISNAIALTLGSDPAGFDYQQTALAGGTSQEGTTVFKVDVFLTGGTTPQYTFYYFSFYDEAANDAVLKAYTQTPELIAGTFEFPADSEYFILTMDSDGTYAFELINNEFSLTQTADASDAEPGNYNPKMFIVGTGFFDTLPEGATPDIVIDGFDGKNVDQNVFVNQNGIGVGNGNLEDNEYVTLEFTQDQTEVIFTIGKLQTDRSVTFLISADGKPAIEYTVLGTSPALTVNASDFGLTDFDSLKITKIAGDQVNIGSITFNSQTVVSDATYNFQVSVRDGDGDVFVSPDQLTVQLEGNDGLASSVATTGFELSALFQDTANTQTIVPTDVNVDSTADMVVVMDSLHHTLNSTNFIVS
jgi:Domain of unknown function (DUF5801)/Bacterial Ig domain